MTDHQPLTADEEAEIREKHAETTPEWRHSDEEHAEITGLLEPDERHSIGKFWGAFGDWSANIDFAVAAHAAVPRLLATLDTERARNARFTEIADPSKASGAHLSHAEVASQVRMLTRDQIDHEAVCVTARDRIMYLADQLAAERARAEKAEALRDEARQKGEAILRSSQAALSAEKARRDRLVGSMHHIRDVTSKETAPLPRLGMANSLARAALADMPAAEESPWRGIDISWVPAYSAWNDATFGTPDKLGGRGPAAHLIKEAAEARDNPGDIKEWGDCLLLVIDGSRREGFGLEQVFGAARDKVLVLMARKWGKPDADGAVEHIRETAAPPITPATSGAEADAQPVAAARDAGWFDRETKAAGKQLAWADRSDAENEARDQVLDVLRADYGKIGDSWWTRPLKTAFRALIDAEAAQKGADR